MAEQITNMEKYENYREQMGRLKKAIEAKFFLEAVFIEYAVMEDRLESIIRYSGTWNYKPNAIVQIGPKLKKIYDMSLNEENLIHKYFPAEFIVEIDEWKEKRNPYIHSLLKQKIKTADLEEFALQGREIVKKLNSASTSYKRALQKQNEKNPPKK